MKRYDDLMPGTIMVLLLTIMALPIAFHPPDTDNKIIDVYPYKVVEQKFTRDGYNKLVESREPNLLYEIVIIDGKSKVLYFDETCGDIKQIDKVTQNDRPTKRVPDKSTAEHADTRVRNIY